MAVINKTGITNGATIEAEHITRAIDALSGVSTDTIVATGSFSGSLVGNATLTNLNVDAISFPNVTYTISGSGTSVVLNDQDDDTNTIIKHHGGLISSSFLETGVAINGPVIATSYTGSLSGTATSASYATTASYVANASSFPYTGSARITGSLGVTGSLSVDGTITTSGITTLQNNLSVTGSVFTSGSTIGFAGELDSNTNITANKEGIINLSGLGGTGTYLGKFILPTGEPAQPVAGTIYWDDSTGVLYVYQQSTTSWIVINP